MGRIRRSVSPLDDSRLQNSRLDDSRISRRSSFDDSRLRSPVSSPLGSKRSSSRSLSPLSPTHETSYTLAATPGPKKGKGKSTPASKLAKGKVTPASKQAKGKVTPSAKTPATKRGRASPASTPRSTTRSAKKSRVNSPEEKSLKLQLSETLEPASQESLKLQLSETLEAADESPIKKVTRKKRAAVVDSDSE